MRKASNGEIGTVRRTAGNKIVLAKDTGEEIYIEAASPVTAGQAVDGFRDEKATVGRPPDAEGDEQYIIPHREEFKHLLAAGTTLDH